MIANNYNLLKADRNICLFYSIKNFHIPLSHYIPNFYWNFIINLYPNSNENHFNDKLTINDKTSQIVSKISYVLSIKIFTLNNYLHINIYV